MPRRPPFTNPKPSKRTKFASNKEQETFRNTMLNVSESSPNTNNSNKKKSTRDWAKVKALDYMRDETLSNVVFASTATRIDIIKDAFKYYDEDAGARAVLRDAMRANAKSYAMTKKDAELHENKGGSTRQWTIYESTAMMASLKVLAHHHKELDANNNSDLLEPSNITKVRRLFINVVKLQDLAVTCGDKSFFNRSNRSFKNKISKYLTCHDSNNKDAMMIQDIYKYWGPNTITPQNNEEFLDLYHKKKILDENDTLKQKVKGKASKTDILSSVADSIQILVGHLTESGGDLEEKQSSKIERDILAIPDKLNAHQMKLDFTSIPPNVATIPFIPPLPPIPGLLPPLPPIKSAMTSTNSSSPSCISNDNNDTKIKPEIPDYTNSDNGTKIKPELPDCTNSNVVINGDSIESFVDLTLSLSDTRLAGQCLSNFMNLFYEDMTARGEIESLLKQNKLHPIPRPILISMVERLCNKYSKE